MKKVTDNEMPFLENEMLKGIGSGDGRILSTAVRIAHDSGHAYYARCYESPLTVKLQKSYHEHLEKAGLSPPMRIGTISTGGKKYGYTLTREIPGVTIKSLPAGRLRGLTDQFSSLLAGLHGIRAPRFHEWKQALVRSSREDAALLRKVYMYLKKNPDGGEQKFSLVHRDLNPSNIILSTDNEMYIVDFISLRFGLPLEDFVFILQTGLLEKGKEKNAGISELYIGIWEKYARDNYIDRDAFRIFFDIFAKKQPVIDKEALLLEAEGYIPAANTGLL